MRLLKHTLVFTIAATIMLTLGFAESAKPDLKKVNGNINLLDKRQNLPPLVTPQHIDVGRTEDFTLVLTDSYGDGWDGANMDVFVNGTLIFDDITVAASEDVFTFAVDDGDLVETAYTSGSYEYEHSYAFYDNAGAFVAGDGPTPGAGISFTVEISVAVYGCTDVAAINYDPNATDDDGSCYYFNLLTLEVGGGSWGSEVSWYVDGTDYAGSVGTFLLDLADGDYVFYGGDSYGDTWNGNTAVISDDEGNVLLSFTGPPDDCAVGDGCYGTADFTVGGEVIVWGCTDETAINFDSDATADDGSCFYTGDVCEYPYDAIIGTNTSGGGEQWFSLDITEAGFLSIDLPEYDAVQVLGVCGVTDGYFDDFISVFYQTGESLFHSSVILDEETGATTADYIGTTIHFRIAGWYTSDPMDFTVGWAPAVEGCTDVFADNFDESANVGCEDADGDGLQDCCVYSDCETNQLTINMTDSYGDSWNGNVLMIGEFAFTLDGVNDDGEFASVEACLDDGFYIITCDGGSWQSEVSWEILSADSLLLAGGAPFSGTLTLGETDDIPGCMDENAINYNPDATVDDGSCVYEYGEACEYPVDGGTVNGDVIYGATTEAGDFVWYSFVLDADYDNVSVSLCGSDYDTKLEVWGACDDTDYLGYNDDAPCEGRSLQSQVDLTGLVAGTYYAKVYGYGSSFGNYVLTITAFADPTAPTLTAAGILNAVELAWEGVPTRSATAHESTTINPIDKVTNKPYDQNTVTFTEHTSRSAYVLTVGGGSWDSEITWNISDLSGTELYAGVAETYDIDLDDGTYVFNGFDSYGDGWNGGMATLVDAGGTVQFSLGLDSGTEFSAEFTVPTADVYGCTDPNALNYDPNATLDDGSCEYTPPPNDECTAAEAVAGPYPATVTGTTLGATVDCPDMLTWNAAWYSIDLPYDANSVTITLCGDDAAIENAGIILMDDCACDDYIVSSYSWTDEGCLELAFGSIAGLESVMYPAYIVPQQNFTFTVEIEEVYLPSFNVFKDGAVLAEGVFGDGFVDSDVLGDTEYCYTVEQVMPDGGLSGMSNEACAMPITAGSGDTCDDPLVAINTVDGQNDAAYAPLFYSYTVQTDCELEITSQNAAGDAPWDTYLFVLGSCDVDADGNFTDVIGYNDDCCGYYGPSTFSFIATAGQEVILYWGDNWDSQPFTFFVAELTITDCEDDDFEDDDTKGTAVNHDADGTFTYALCQYDNEGGLGQPSGVAAIDWSVVTLQPFNMLTVITHGTGDAGNDIDLFFEDYAGDGVCAWGGGDDLAGSGNAASEEEAAFLNTTTEAMDVYVGVIYYAGENPIPYELTITTAQVPNADAPQNLTATLAPDGSYADITWDPPYVEPTQNARSPQISKVEAESAPEVFKLHSTNHNGRAQITNKGPKNTVDLTINEFRSAYVLTVGGGSYDSEITWDITDLDANVLYSGIAGVFDIDLADGTYIFNGYDSWGDGWNGATATLLDADGNVQFTGGLPSGDSFALEFTVPNAEVYGCTDPDASNYNPDATVDDGSCVYQGDSCDDPLTATAGSNEAAGVGPQWFSYTATMDALLTVTSQNETGDAIPDTYLALLGSCDVDEDNYYVDVLGVNDDCCDYYGPSTVAVQVAAGQEVKIYWIGSYSPGPFTFWVTEVELTCEDDEYEDNDSSSEAAAIDVGTYELQLCAVDPDWFEITVGNGQALRLTVTDASQTGMVDVGIWVFEIDDTYTQAYSPNQNEHVVEWANDSDHAMIADFAIGDFWDGVPETAYTLTVELINFEQMTYTVYRSDDGADEVAIASGLLLTEYADAAIESGHEYCYTATANLGGIESGHSEPPACISLVPPPDAPYNITAEGAWHEEEFPAVQWTWMHDEYEEPIQLIDCDGNEFSEDLLSWLGDGYCDDGTYGVNFLCDEWGWDCNDCPEHQGMPDPNGWCSDGRGYTTTYNKEGVQVVNVQDIIDGTYQIENTRDVALFELVFEYGGTEYAFQTTGLELLIYGFAEGDYVCGWVYAVSSDGQYSDASDQACAEAGGSTGCDVAADHLEGWNMVSLPVTVEDASPGALYTDAIDGTLFGYPYGDPLTTLVSGEGYWLRFSAAGGDILTGDCTDDVSVSMMEGWNMIGSVSASAGIADPNGIIVEGTLYGYPYGDPETSIEPGNGYWVRTSAAGDVTVSTSALGGLARVSDPVANVLNINGMNMYFGMEMNDKDALSYSMPPKPPTGAFDVRFAGDMRAIDESGKIQIQSANHLSISWNVTQEAGDHMQWVLTSTRGEDIELSGSGSIELAGNISGFTLNKVAEIPEQFMLAQNFPNPFNPVTSIEYALPEESFVKISIYNVMGQKVTDLVSDVMPGGYHSVVWNSTNLRGEQVSSGIYLYTIEAEGFTSVKKMVLMK